MNQQRKAIYDDPPNCRGASTLRKALKCLVVLAASIRPAANRQ